MKILKYFWSDVILTVCYLINQISSSILQNQISYSVLYPKMPPNIFGCVCFIQNTNSHKTKLDSRALKYNFLEHSRTQKGYSFIVLYWIVFSFQLMSRFLF